MNAAVVHVDEGKLKFYAQQLDTLEGSGRCVWHSHSSEAHLLGRLREHRQSLQNQGFREVYRSVVAPGEYVIMFLQATAQLQVTAN